MRNKVSQILNRFMPKYTASTIRKEIQCEFAFLFAEYGYSIHQCYFEKFDYWDVALVSYSERMKIWISSERYVTLYLAIPSEPYLVSVEEVVAHFMDTPALRRWCNYEVNGKGIKLCAHFLREYYSTLREIVDQMDWHLTEELLNKSQELFIEQWKYEDDCWTRKLES